MVACEFIKQYYSQLADPPREILVPKPISEQDMISEMLHTKIYTPKKGDKYQLLLLASKDAQEMSKNLSERMMSRREREEELREVLSRILGQQKKVYRIESYDISNTNGVDTVGGMVVYDNLNPVKRDYRRFKIRNADPHDDYGSLREVLRRRFARALEGDKSFSHLPDLILMDGGLGQVTSACSVLEDMGLDIPVLGMAKDDSHRTRALVNAAGDELLLKNYPMLFKYCGTIQEEVHRYAIEYHRDLRRRNAIGSVLDDIPGIGPRKRNALLEHFGSVSEIREATAEKLMECPGITEKNARSIIDFFSSEG